MGVLELHVWAPAFSLPSLDAQCLAAIAYLSQAVPRGSWRLIASSDPSLSPTRELPALRSADVWIGGFRNIVDYILKYSEGAWSLDGDLDGLKKADCIAFSAFVEAHGQPLLDLSLYVSSQNYTTVTRPLYSGIQPFPLQYITPSSIRSAAKKRSAHLGLSSLDIDSDPIGPEDRNQSIIPQSLRPAKITVSSLLSQSPEHAAQIRLDTLAVSFFEELQALRGNKRFFVSSSPTSLDCLALGYLALALLPDLPSPWLAKCMRQKFPQLCAFVHDTQLSFYGGAIQLEHAYLAPALTSEQQSREKRTTGNRALPWAPPDRVSVAAFAKTLSSSIADSLPVVSQLRQADRLKEELEETVEVEGEREALEEAATARRREIFTSAASIVLSIGMFVGFSVWYGLLGRIAPPERTRAPGGASGGPDKSEGDEINGKTVLEALEDIGMGLDALTNDARSFEDR